MSEIGPEEKEPHNIFILGLCVLFGWMAVIIVCASPQLFRNLINKYLCCCVDADRRRNEEKIKMAEARLITYRQSVMSKGIANIPSEILFQQALGRTTITPIPEESRAGTLAPEDEPDIEPLSSPSIS